MPPTFQRFQRGQLFRPNQQTVNGMVAAAESYQFHARDPGDAGNDFYSPSYQFEGIYIQVRNDSGSALPRFGVGGLNGPLVSDSQKLTTFQEQPRFSVVTPAATIHTGKFCILLEPLATGAIGPAMLVGTCMVEIRLAAAPPQCNWNADVADGQAGYLAPADGGMAQVLWTNPSKDVNGAAISYPCTVWGLVRLPSGPERHSPGAAQGEPGELPIGPRSVRDLQCQRSADYRRIGPCLRSARRDAGRLFVSAGPGQQPLLHAGGSVCLRDPSRRHALWRRSLPVRRRRRLGRLGRGLRVLGNYRLRGRLLLPGQQRRLVGRQFRRLVGR